MKIQAKKLKKSSLFRLILAGSVLPVALFFLLCGISALFGNESVKWNNEPVTGVRGLFAAIAMFPFFILAMSGILWMAAALGLWAYSWFWKLKLEFVEGTVIGGSEPE